MGLHHNVNAYRFGNFAHSLKAVIQTTRKFGVSVLL